MSGPKHATSSASLRQPSAGLADKLFRLLLNQLLFVLSYLVPRRKNLVVLGSGLGRRFMGNPKYLYLRLLERRTSTSCDAHSLEPVWITENDTLHRELRARGWPVLRKFSLQGFWALLRSEFLVVESGMRAADVTHDVAYAWLLYGRFKVIQTWHGSPMKHICLDALADRGLDSLLAKAFYAASRREFSSLECVVAQSNYDQAILSRTFSNSNVPLLGCARNDAFVRETLSFEQVEHRFGLQRYERLIVYAPTYREARAEILNARVFKHREGEVMPFSSEFLRRMDERLSDRRWLLLVKRHHLDRALKIPDGLKNIVDVGPLDDIQELLVHADLLVTDYSSICFDFLAADRPIVYYAYDLAQYLEDVKALYLDFELDIVGPIAFDETELWRLIEQAESWFFEPGYRGRFRAFQQRFHKYPDGGAADRLIRYMMLRSSGMPPAEASARVRPAPVAD